jgi:hypothetical protein
LRRDQRLFAGIERCCAVSASSHVPIPP